jgi:enoyl-CoA hydratase
MTDEELEVKARAVIVEERPPCAIVRINRAPFRNSLSVNTLEDLDSAVSAVIKRGDVRAVVFTGTDDVFASGADIRELKQLTPVLAGEFASRGQRLFRKIADAPQLTIAAINGYCMGGGLDLALCCDLRCAAPNAVFAHPGARLGIITGWGGTQRLPRLVGTARAFEMFATARRVGAREAYEIGLVSKVGEPVLDCALEMATAHGLKARITF